MRLAFEGKELPSTSENEEEEEEDEDEWADPDDIIFSLRPKEVNRMFDQDKLKAIKEEMKGVLKHLRQSDPDERFAVVSSDIEDEEQPPARTAPSGRVNAFERSNDAHRLAWSQQDEDGQKRVQPLADVSINTRPVTTNALHSPISLARRKPGRDKTPWSQDEVDLLERGMRQYGRSWAKILSAFGHGPNGFADGRTGPDLKDKARNEAMRRDKLGLDKGPF